MALGLLASLVVLTLSGGCSTPPAETSTIERSIQFLRQEVPAWSVENKCFSCHNNGDAARALLIASQQGYQVSPAALTDTLQWLERPNQWDKNQGDPGFSDQRLANIQFAAALRTALNSGHLQDRSALVTASRQLVADQDPDGAWPIDPSNSVGSPATYGTVLATAMALNVLVDSKQPSPAIESAARWLNNRQPFNVPTAAALLMATHRPEAQPENPRTDCLEFLLSAQTKDGGWGPYPDAPPEVFDTALALLALAEHRGPLAVAEGIQRGRTFLRISQLSDGSWPATTRPSGGNSYAQRVSTTGWATLALLATE